MSVCSIFIIYILVYPYACMLTNPCQHTQGSVLAPIMFAIYLNDMDDGINSYMSFFTDDAKLMRKVSTKEDCESLQQDLNKLLEWSQKWEMDFKIKKMQYKGIWKK